MLKPMGAAITNTNPISVLIVDDHPVVRDGYRRLLESAGDITVIAEASSGEAGYQAYKDHAPDVVIMDLSMRGIGGLEAIRRIVQRDPKAKILVFSVHENAIFEERAREAGAIGYVSKRCAPTEMVEAVHTVGRGEPFVSLSDITDAGAIPNEKALIRSLTLREFEVFQLIAEGHSVAQVANILNISQNTAGVHQTRIMHKLGTKNAAQLTLMAIRNGLVKP